MRHRETHAEAIVRLPEPALLGLADT